METGLENETLRLGATLTGQVALVTGGATGIGKAISLAMHRAGAAVAVNYKHDPNLADELVASIEADGGRALAVYCDVGNPNDVNSMFEKVIAELGTVDILIGNAGIQKDATFLKMSLAEWEGALKVDLTGLFLCMQAAAREFVRRGVVAQTSRAAGKIICISSVHQLIPWAGHVNYAAAKGGVEMLMRSAAQELAPERIRVNSLAPGAIKTAINESVWSNPQSLDKLMTLIPYKRMGSPEDVAAAAVWLASDAADYVTGSTLFVDGGMSLYAGFADGG
jgi:glucose 1-dehydrogenase